MPHLVLASTSRYRQALLRRLGVPFWAIGPECDEEAFRHLLPYEQALTLAVRKAESLPPAALPAEIRDHALIIGSDQVVDAEGVVLPKPGTAEAALAQLRLLSGRTHRLITAIAVHDTRSGRTTHAVDVHELTMRALPEATLAAYVAADQPLDCAGSYVLERRGLALFSQIRADPVEADDSAVVGLPLLKLCRLLREAGYEVLDQGPTGAI